MPRVTAIAALVHLTARANILRSHPLPGLGHIYSYALLGVLSCCRSTRQAFGARDGAVRSGLGRAVSATAGRTVLLITPQRSVPPSSDRRYRRG